MSKWYVVLTKPKQEEIEQYESFFKCPVEFDAKQNTIVLHQGILKEPLRQPDKLLLKTLESHAENQISTLDESDLSFSIRVRVSRRIGPYSYLPGQT